MEEIVEVLSPAEGVYTVRLQGGRMVAGVQDGTEFWEPLQQWLQAGKPVGTLAEQ